jgi:WD40 repeat protein
LQAQAGVPLLALGNADNSISLLDRHGKPACQAVIRAADQRAALECLAWHPHSQVLSAAWSSGSVSIANVLPSGAVAEKALSGSAPAQPVLTAWSPVGSTLIVGYSSGDFCIWKAPPNTDEDPLAWAQVLRPVLQLWNCKHAWTASIVMH